MLDLALRFWLEVRVMVRIRQVRVQLRIRVKVRWLEFGLDNWSAGVRVVCPNTWLNYTCLSSDQCGCLNERCLPYAHVFEHLIST